MGGRKKRWWKNRRWAERKSRNLDSSESPPAELGPEWGKREGQPGQELPGCPNLRKGKCFLQKRTKVRKKQGVGMGKGKWESNATFHFTQGRKFTRGIPCKTAEGTGGLGGGYQFRKKGRALLWTPSPREHTGGHGDHSSNPSHR